ncbi:MAG TPA: preprotein translocase subunit SecA, partial [Pirellulales bacterium]|nr:preprotein translocase subunit SecA [Pirellulales bacterium]
GALPTEEEKIAAECHRWSASVVKQFEEDEHYEWDHDDRRAELTAAGRQMARGLPLPEMMHAVGMTTIYEYLERAIKVEREYILDRHYVVREGEIQIVDEFTGRIAEGRKWRDGIHQAVEAKEGVTVTTGTGQAARVTVQDFFLRYKHLAGMTGTAITSAGELARIYELQVVPIPTNRPAIRQRYDTQIFSTSDTKWAAIVAETAQMHETGRPVLIGTRSIDKSEMLSRLLDAAGIEHSVLNAHQIAREAQIVAEAGHIGRVTVSTNMAGRGTDIKLGAGVQELGGLHVICTEMHDAARIDRQLIGRCGRQGDRGTYRQYLAMDDDILLAGFGPPKAAKLKAQGTSNSDGLGHLASLFERAQRRIEQQKFRQRRVLLYHESERKKAQEHMGQDPYLDTPG